MIIVNSKHMIFDKKEISYEDILKLLGLPNGLYTIMFTRGVNGQKGLLDKGQSTRVKDGMVINCDRTDNA